MAPKIDGTCLPPRYERPKTLGAACAPGQPRSTSLRCHVTDECHDISGLLQSEWPTIDVRTKLVTIATFESAPAAMQRRIESLERGTIQTYPALHSYRMDQICFWNARCRALPPPADNFTRRLHVHAGPFDMTSVTKQLLGQVERRSSTGRHDTDLRSRDARARVCRNIGSDLQKKAQGNAGCPLHPQPVCVV
jgi:hypothetical protein